LTPQLKDLHPPDLLPGAVGAAAAIVNAVRSGAKIVIYGDYDVDGTASVAILWHALTFLGARVFFYVPHRTEEGYGLNPEAVDRLVQEGAGFIITVDCGITAVDVADTLRRAGVPLVVTDHHAPHTALPPAEAIVHPALSGTACYGDTPLAGGSYPNPDLAGAGVAFKVAWAIGQKVSGADRVDPRFRSLLLDLLPLAALGTIADVVPLRGENRIIARYGLEGLVGTRLPGLRALIESAGLSGGRISGYDVGFKLAPRINAAGRMGHARLAVELLTRADTDRAREITLYLEEHNRSRQATERQMTRDAVERIEGANLAGDARRAIVLASHGWHAGVIGIVAARLVDRFHRPAIMISVGTDEAQGSGRSIPGFDLHAALASCAEHLRSYGGHAMAAGIRLAPDQIEPFTDAFLHVANGRLTGEDLVPKLRLDAEISLDELTMPTAEAVLALGPFGLGNPRPRFASDWIELADEPRAVGQHGRHLSASFHQDGVRMRAIGFGLADRLEDLKQHRRCRVAFEPIINEFNGRRSVEMQVVDFRFPD
jgi:single-stranded-DNA-specific exonuclease